MPWQKYSRRIGRAAGGDDDSVGLVGFTVCLHTAYRTVFPGQNLFYGMFKFKFHAQSLDVEKQRIYDIQRLVGHREYTVAALGFERYTLVFKKVHHVSRAASAQR